MRLHLRSRWLIVVLMPGHGPGGRGAREGFAKYKKQPCIMDNYYTATELKDRRWTSTAIIKFAGPPDTTIPNPFHETGAPMRFWLRERITHIEETQEFVLWKAGSDKRRSTRQTPIETEFLTGSAGTGKTYEVQARRAGDPEGGVVLAATSGAAAVNLGAGVTTLHSLLGGFRDSQALIDAYHSDKLQRNSRRLVDDGMHGLIVDEISMLCAPAMDALYNGCNDVAQAADHPQIKLTLVGDFCQLPPIPDADVPGSEKYAFEAACWEANFSTKTKRLSHIWRQDNVDFVHALQAARRGDGAAALAGLQAVGVPFEPRLNNTFEGTTLCATDDIVDAYNRERLLLVPPVGSAVIAARSIRWSIPGPDGFQPSEWQQIPEWSSLKIGAYVMILNNDTPAFNWVNGDVGVVVGTVGTQLAVRLRRNDRDVLISRITRTINRRTKPAGIPDEEMITVGSKREYDAMVLENGEPPRQVVEVHESPRPTWITGWVNYYPIRLAYAITVHKSQGLSLDSLQLDLSSNFLGAPAMMYVALSRCKTPEGLVLVGSPEQVVQKTKVDPKVMEWL
jgi:ATP-dependent DNA helicase PIF1